MLSGHLNPLESIPTATNQFSINYTIDHNLTVKAEVGLAGLNCSLSYITREK